MLDVADIAELSTHLGKSLGHSDWVTVDQPMIDRFAEATGDHQWIHVDTARAARELPDGKTIAHGYLTLSLIPRLNAEILNVRQKSRGVNYGSNKVRFTAPVPAGSRIRSHATLKAIDPMDAGAHRLTMETTVEVEGSDRPALIAETLSLIYP